MKIRNFTPHAVVYMIKGCESCSTPEGYSSELSCSNGCDFSGNIALETFQSEGTARVSVTEKPIGRVNSLSLYSEQFGEVAGLPDPEKDTLFIVSRMVKSALPERDDLICPNQLVRNESGEIIGCRGFIK